MDIELRDILKELKIPEYPDISGRGILLLSPNRYLRWSQDSIYFHYGIGCLETVLNQSQRAYDDFQNNIVSLWALPEYDALLDMWTEYAVKEAVAGKTKLDFIRDLPMSPIINISEKVKEEMHNRIGDFIESHFNSEKAIKYGHLRVTRQGTTTLSRIIALYSVAFFDDDRQILIPFLEMWPDNKVEKAMTEDQSIYTSRKHRDVTGLLKGAGLNILLHNSTVKRWCGIWYLIRIKRGNFPVAMQDLADGKYPELIECNYTNNESYIRDHIKPCDIATGI